MFVPNNRVWLELKQGETDYYILSSSGDTVVDIGSINTFRLDDSPNCLPGGTPEDADLVMFYCLRFAMEGRNLNQALGRSVS